jgi:hypothetical protein
MMIPMSPGPEGPAARGARHWDTALSAAVAALLVVGLALRGVRGPGLLAAAVLGGGAALAVLVARRAGWDWGLAARILLAYGAAAALLWATARTLGYR